jgi:hypothetical protein
MVGLRKNSFINVINALFMIRLPLRLIIERFISASESMKFLERRWQQFLGVDEKTLRYWEDKLGVY